MNLGGILGDGKAYRFVSYSRVSSEEQIEGYSLDEQDDIDRRYGESKSWSLVGTYRDEGKSAKTTQRADFQRMMQAAELGQFDVIIVWNISRLTRSLTDMFLILRDLDRCGVKVVSVTEPFDFTHVIGRAVLAVIVGFAEWYLQQLALDTARGHKARAEQGKWNSQLPYGYYAAYKKYGGDGLALPHDHERWGVLLAFERYAAAAYGDATIATILNEAGYRPEPKREGTYRLTYWTKDSIRVLLQNRFYIGEVQYKGEWMPGIHEPIVSPELFEQCQEVRASRYAHRTQHSQKHTDRVYLLSGIIKCAGCGNPARAQSQETTKPSKKTGDTLKYTYRYYTCHGGWKGHKCALHGKYIRAKKIEAQVADYFKRLVLPPDWRDRILQAIGKPVPDAKDRRKKLEGQLKRLGVLYKLGDLEDAEYMAERQRLKDELAELTPALSAPLVSAAELLDDFAAIWAEGTDEERKVMIQTFVQEVVAHPKEGLLQLHIKTEYQPLFSILDVRK